jgi:hypothetical protein
LAHQAPRKVVAPRAPHAALGEFSEDGHLFGGAEKRGNFSMGAGSYFLKGLTALPRFSSLSGRLNPN